MNVVMKDVNKTTKSALDKKEGIRKGLINEVGRNDADMIWNRAKEILADIEQRYSDVPKGQQMHTSFIFPSAAVQLAAVEVTGDKQIGYKAISEYSWAKSRKMGAMLKKMSKIPGFNKWFVSMWDPISRKSFGPNAGFKNVFYPKAKGEYRMDITECPYNTYFTKLGTPELTEIFCINDEYSYGGVPGLEFIRHTTLGTGGDKCDFYIRVTPGEATPDSVKKEAGIWDRFAPVYAIAMQKDRKIYKRMYKRIREVSRGKTVLELACGPGLIAKHVADVTDHMIATDFSGKMLDQAKKGRNPDNLTYEWADASDLKYDDGSFDVVIIGNALHVVPDPARVLSEIRRVLKPDGMLIAPTFIHVQKDGATAVTSKILELAGIKFSSKWNEEEFRAVLVENGFSVTYSEIMRASINEMYVECSVRK